MGLPLRHGGQPARFSVPVRLIRANHMAALGVSLPSRARQMGMDYRKIGQGLQPGAQHNSRAGIAPSLQAKPLADLGLTGLVERLAMAIRESEERDQ